MVSKALEDGVWRAYRVALSEGKSHRGAIQWVAQEKGLPKEMVESIVDGWRAAWHSIVNAVPEK